MDSNSANISIYDFSQHLFWDVNLSDIDINKNAEYIIKKVVIYGFYSDWQLIMRLYGMKTISNCAKKIRELDLKTAHFISIIADTPLNEFKCFTTTQLQPKHWNF